MTRARMYFDPAHPAEPFRVISYRLFKEGLNMTRGRVRGSDAARLWDAHVAKALQKTLPEYGKLLTSIADGDTTDA